jgi:RimJ/RimL family protein N-acetyltransferase
MDAKQFFELNADPEVIRYTGDEAFGSVTEAMEFIQNYDHYRIHGFVRWACVLRSTGEFIGFCGLRKDDQSGETDIGFRIRREFWGKGYATEAALACMNFGFEKIGLTSIIGRAVLENHASIHVLEKLGMEYESETDCHGHKAALYRIKKP